MIWQLTPRLRQFGTTLLVPLLGLCLGVLVAQEPHLRPLLGAAGLGIGLLIQRWLRRMWYPQMQNNLAAQRQTVALVRLVAVLAQVGARAAPIREQLLEVIELRGNQALLCALYDQAVKQAGQYDVPVLALEAQRLAPVQILWGWLLSLLVTGGSLNEAQQILLRQVAQVWGVAFTANQVGPPVLPQEVLATLGLTGEPSLAEVKSAYKRAVKVSHPDKLRGQEAPAHEIAAAEARLQELTAAYDQIVEIIAKNKK